MAQISVNSILTDSDFIEFFDVLRRKIVVDATGRTRTTERKYHRVEGVILPASKFKDDDIHRMPTYQTTRRNIEVITAFRLITQTKDYNPDIVVWLDTHYIVNRIYPYIQYGVGFMVAECDSVDRVDMPYKRDEAYSYVIPAGVVCN